MIIWSQEHKKTNKRGDLYIGQITDQQMEQIDKIDELGGVEALVHALKGITLEMFQTALPAIAYIAKRFIIGADTGLGKSLMIALYLLLHKRMGTLKKCLVVTTNASLNQIHKQIESTTDLKLKYLPGERDVLMASLQDPHLMNYDGFIVANSVFSKSIEFVRIFNFLRKEINVFVFDESMEAANPNSIIHNAIKSFIKDIEYRLLCNATVIEKSVDQLYYQVDLIDETLLPKLEILKKRHEVYGNENGKYKLLGHKDLDKLLKAIKYHYRNESRFERGLVPEYKDVLVPVEMTDLQRRVATPQNYWFAYCSPTTQKETSVIPFDEEHVPALRVLLDLTFMALIDGPVVIYAEPTACKEVIRDALLKRRPDLSIGIIDGMTIDQGSVRDRFNGGEIDVVIINIPEALDLWAGKSMIFYTIPSKHYQARGRIARSLGEIKVTYYYIVYLHSFQSMYIKNTLLRDEQTLNNAQNRGFVTARNLSRELYQLESASKPKVGR